MAWTTTPWTLVSNLAIAAGPDIDYVKVQDPHSHKCYILAASRLSSYFKHPEEEIVIARMKGRDLEGRRYLPAFSYFTKHTEAGAFRVIADDFVTVEDGTGLVHCAPGFGEADFYACQKRGIPVVCPVDQNGQFTQEIPEYVGRFVKDCDKEIIKHLKAEGRVLKHESLRHRYPFCWRSDTPLIYKAMSTWFVSVEKFKEKLLAANDQIYWMPTHVKHAFVKDIDVPYELQEQGKEITPLDRLIHTIYCNRPLNLFGTWKHAMKAYANLKSLTDDAVILSPYYQHLFSAQTQGMGTMYKEIFDYLWPCP